MKFIKLKEKLARNHAKCSTSTGSEKLDEVLMDLHVLSFEAGFLKAKQMILDQCKECASAEIKCITPDEIMALGEEEI